MVSGHEFSDAVARLRAEYPAVSTLVPSLLDDCVGLVRAHGPHQLAEAEDLARMRLAIRAEQPTR